MVISRPRESTLLRSVALQARRSSQAFDLHGLRVRRAFRSFCCLYESPLDAADRAWYALDSSTRSIYLFQSSLYQVYFILLKGVSGSGDFTLRAIENIARIFRRVLRVPPPDPQRLVLAPKLSGATALFYVPPDMSTTFQDM